MKTYYIHITSQKLYDSWIDFFIKQGYKWNSGHGLKEWTPLINDIKSCYLFIYLGPASKKIVCYCDILSNTSVLPISKHKIYSRQLKLERILK